MNVFFSTQANSLEMFYLLWQNLKQRLPIQGTGFYVADQCYYEHFLTKYPEFESQNFEIIREWELAKQSRVKPVFDRAVIEKFEARLGEPTLWNALVAERRIYMGKSAPYRQDYKPRFTHEQMLALLQNQLQTFETVFERLKPDLVISFIAVTVGDYLSYLFAKQRQSTFINLRPSRIRNHFVMGSTLWDPDNSIQNRYAEFYKQDIPNPLKETVLAYHKQITTKFTPYEGVLKKSSKIARTPVSRIPLKLLQMIQDEFRHRFGTYRFDYANSAALRALTYNVFIKPLKKKLHSAYIRRHSISTDELRKVPFAFFPLHTEPEVSLLVNARHHLNQIEAIRNASMSLPVGWKLLVKEHPVAFGKRTLGYYKKILEIPNVLLANFSSSTWDILPHCQMTVTINSSVGFEALLFKKPVICLAGSLYDFLPQSMVRKVTDFTRLPFEIRSLFKEHNHDEKAIHSYIAATMAECPPVDFYSNLLQKRNAHSTRSKATPGIDLTDINTLADFVEKRFKNTLASL